jgi:nickel-dependent lactate racemase
MVKKTVISKTAELGAGLTGEQVIELVTTSCPQADYRNQKVLLIIPDGTRTAPVGLVFKVLHEQMGAVTRALDILVALGTHQPMSETAICQRLEITPLERQQRYGRVKFFNHAWNDPAALKRLGMIRAEEIRELTHGLFAMDVAVEINRLVFEYDRILILGPVFPHEVVGFSGGNKYLFPGIAGAEILNFFHWLGAVITNAKIIGHGLTPVRRVIDRAAALLPVDKGCLCMVVAPDHSLAGLFAGAPETAWEAASELSRQLHITFKDRPFHTILSCAPPMYDELWTGGKCMYKLEPVLADDGELIIYAPHISEISFTHGALIEEVGYHCRDYFLKQWERFKHYPWGILAHATHVYGQGTFEHGVETPRARVTLATQISEAQCRRINLSYRDPRSIRAGDFAESEEQGILLVPRAGEMLFQLRQPPAWARG